MRWRSTAGLFIIFMTVAPITLSFPPSPAAAAGSPLHRYSNGGLSFRYPSSWKVGQFNDASSFSASIVDLSNQKMHSPCKSTKVPGGTSSSCGWPLTRLRPNGVLVEWSDNGFPDPQGSPPALGPGLSRTVDGRAARIQITLPGVCKSIGGQESVDVIIARDVPDNTYSLTACLRGPGLKAGIATISRLLQSVKFAAGT
jgi:hypothetical protein